MPIDRSPNSSSSDPVNEPSRTKAELHKIEARMRRQVSAIARRVSLSIHHDEGQELPSRKVREGIVSINGQDVETMRCTGGKHAR